MNILKDLKQAIMLKFCLVFTEDVVWVIPCMFYKEAKMEFYSESENESFMKSGEGLDAEF